MTIHPKVVAATGGSVGGGAVTIIVVWGLSLHGVSVPANVQEAFTVIFSAAIALIAGYMTASPEAKGSL